MSSKPASRFCTAGGVSGPEGCRREDAATELVFPAVTFASRRVLDLAGEDKLRQLVRRQYAHIKASPIPDLYIDNPWGFARMAENVADFIVACGGRAAYSGRSGPSCMRTRHFAVTIDEAARETWLAALFRAMEEVDFPVEVGEEYWSWLEAFSVRMINRRTMKEQPARIPFAAAQAIFGGRSGEGLPCAVSLPFCPRV